MIFTKIDVVQGLVCLYVAGFFSELLQDIGFFYLILRT